MLYTKTHAADIEFRRVYGGGYYSVYVNGSHSGYSISRAGSHFWVLRLGGSGTIGFYRTFTAAKTDVIDVLL